MNKCLKRIAKRSQAKLDLNANGGSGEFCAGINTKQQTRLSYELECYLLFLTKHTGAIGVV